MARKRAMYRKLGAPVERVLDFLSDFRTRMRLKKDQESLSWMMEARAAHPPPARPRPTTAHPCTPPPSPHPPPPPASDAAPPTTTTPR